MGHRRILPRAKQMKMTTHMLKLVRNTKLCGPMTNGHTKLKKEIFPGSAPTVAYASRSRTKNRKIIKTRFKKKINTE